MLGGSGLLLFGKMEGNNKCIVTVCDGHGTTLRRRKGTKICASLAHLVKNFRAAEEIFHLSEIQPHDSVYLLDQLIEEGMSFVAWKVEGRDIALLISPTLGNIRNEFDVIESLVHLALFCEIGESVYYEGATQREIKRITLESLKIITESRDDKPIYVGVGSNLSAAIDGVSKILK